MTDTIGAARTLVSPEGREITILYDPDTFLTASHTIPGLHETTQG